jgi:hypothetical protein
VYDVNGALLPSGNNKQPAANVYNNNVLQHATEWKQRLNVLAEIKQYGLQHYFIKLTLGQNKEQLIIPNNSNSSYTIAAKAGAYLFNKLRLTAGIESQDQSFSNSNRNGFLNRVYQQSLLTPISFSNSQGAMVNGVQRSFSSYNDNPWFQLGKKNPYINSMRQVHFSAEYKLRQLSIKTIYTTSNTIQQHSEAYQRGTTYFPAGISSIRQQQQYHHNWVSNFTYSSRAGDDWRNEFTANLTKTWIKVNTNYSSPSSTYLWKRNTTDASLTYNCNWTGLYRFEIGASLNNNFYTSATASRILYWLPAAAAYIRWNNFLNSGYIKLYANSKQFVSEPSITQSYAYTNLLKLTSSQAMSFFPDKEVNSFEGLAVEKHHQYSAGAEIYFSYWFNFNANLYVTNTKDAIFPLLSNQQIVLQNLADQRNTAIELQLSSRIKLGNNYSNIFSNTLSFFHSSNTATALRNGFENIPLAGFSNVYKAMVKGAAAGVIIGSDYRYDVNGKKIIGADGFPVADNNLKIIGNPQPDFTMKLNQALSYKRFTIAADWEWRKGGDVWNGTSAVLDYYGRSSISGKLRNTSQFVFDGVTENGRPNTLAVDFYNPSLPVTQNRWVRYGYSGVAKDYIEKGDFVKLNNFSVGYNIPVKKWIRKMEVSVAAENIMLWTAYSGTDLSQLLFDQPAAEGLDFFNLPSVKRFAVAVSIQF